MHEIECILHEYLSFNWDRVEEIFDANSVYLSEDGLKCPWYSNSNLPVSAHPVLPVLAVCTQLMPVPTTICCSDFTPHLLVRANHS